MACDNCRLKKVKCDLAQISGSVCSYCRVHRIECKTVDRSLRRTAKQIDKRKSSASIPSRNSNAIFFQGWNDICHPPQGPVLGLSPSHLHDNTPTSPSSNSPPTHVDLLRLYVERYFDLAQSYFPLLDRTSFEDQLDTAYRNDRNIDPSLFALFNAVFAIGCEFFNREDGPLKKEQQYLSPMSFFVNCLSVQDEICHPKYGITGVQALAAMVLCSEFLPITDTELGLRLCQSAAHLTQSCGLQFSHFTAHCATSYRSRRVLWMVYAMEKFLSIRLGKLSGINDSADPQLLLLEDSVVNEGTEQSLECRKAVEVTQEERFLFRLAQFGRFLSLINDQLEPGVAQIYGMGGFGHAASSLVSRLTVWKSNFEAEFAMSDIKLMGDRWLHPFYLQSCYCFAMCSIFNRVAQASGNGFANDLDALSMTEISSECVSSSASMSDSLKQLSSLRIPSWVKENCLLLSLETISQIQFQQMQSMLCGPVPSTPVPNRQIRNLQIPEIECRDFLNDLIAAPPTLDAPEPIPKLTADDSPGAEIDPMLIPDVDQEHNDDGIINEFLDTSWLEYTLDQMGPSLDPEPEFPECFANPVVSDF